MGIDDTEFPPRLTLTSPLDLSRVMDQARLDQGFMRRVITVLEECGVDDRTDDENALLEWARSFQRRQPDEAEG